MLKRAAFFIATFALSCPSAWAVLESTEFTVKAKSGTNEQYERDVDEVALAAQESAISKLSGLLKKYRGSGQEAVLLSKLAELQQQKASIRFRIAHGIAHKRNKAADLTIYKTTLKQSISTLDDLIRKYPRFSDIPRAYAMRGKAHEETGSRPLATRDFLFLITHFPDDEEAVGAYMSLAEFAIEANDHQKAIGYLKEVEKLPDDSHFPFALYKLSWSYYNLKNIPAALSYAEKHLGYYNARKSQTPGPDGESLMTTSDEAFRENMLLDTTVFFLEGFEQKLPQYAITEALSYFKKLENGPQLGKLLARYAKLLRSHEHEAELWSWKEQVLASEPDRPETLDVLIIAFENQLNKKNYPKIVEVARDFVRFYNISAKHRQFEGIQKARKLLLDTADALQKVIVKNKAAENVGAFSLHLAALYDSFTKIVEETDPRIARAHYNLAETLFEIKDFDRATQHYRWVVEHGKWDLKNSKTPANVVDSSLKAIASRYELLRQKQMIPGQLSAISLKENKDKEIDPIVREWVRWIDTHIDETDDPIENFYFEANRTLYSLGQLNEAVKRMTEFSTDYPSSKFAIPSATLALDTYLVSENWEQSHDVATQFLEIKQWKSTDFGKTLFTAAADSYYKMIEEKAQKSEHKQVLNMSDEFLDNYTKSKRLAECLILAGNSALVINEKDRADKYFSRLIAEAPDSDTLGEALLARASMAEDRYLFRAAAGDYKTILGLPPAQKKSITIKPEILKKKTLALAWLSTDLEFMKTLLGDRAICPEATTEECERYQALIALVSGGTAPAAGSLKDSSANNRTLWAAVALQTPKNLQPRDRLLLAKQAAKHWNDLDPLDRYLLIPFLSNSIPKIFQMNRIGIQKGPALKADERSIARRVEAVREVERAALPVMKLPWSRIRALVLNELAAMYLDLAKALKEIPIPKELPQEEIAAYNETIMKLTLPFEEKGQEMRGKAFEIASRFAIEQESFDSIATPFFLDNPSQAKALQPKTPLPKAVAFNLTQMKSIDPDGNWSSLNSGSKAPPVRLKSLWAEALQAKRWQQVAFFMQEAQEKAFIQAGVMGTVKALSLIAAGAQGEGLYELEEARQDLKPEIRLRVDEILQNYFQRSLNREKSAAYEAKH